MASNVELALDEIQASLAAIAPVHEGLRDYARLNLKPQTLAIVNDTIADYDRRVAALEAAKLVLEALVGDGHPLLAPREIPDSAKADLDENLSTITAADRIFTSGAAVGIGLAGSPPEPKS